MSRFPEKNRPRAELVLLSALALSLVGSVLYLGCQGVHPRTSDAAGGGGEAQVSDQLLQELDAASAAIAETYEDEEIQLFTSELRVAAVGSGYPIPYDAEVCPFSNIRQPAMNEMDRDGDGITDDWEVEFGLDKSDKRDAGKDSDGDGFTNLEEFRSGADPMNASSHPLYVHKLRFVEEKIVPFPLVFQGYTELADGSMVFQLNERDRGKSHFASLGESVQGVVLHRFSVGDIGEDPRLYVMKGSVEVELIRGKTVPDPENRAELINILDRTTVMVTMGALLSLHSDEYTVLGVHNDKVVVRHLGTGEVFDIVGLADGER